MYSKSTSPEPPAHPNSSILIFLYPNLTASLAVETSAYA